MHQPAVRSHPDAFPPSRGRGGVEVPPSSLVPRGGGGAAGGLEGRRPPPGAAWALVFLLLCPAAAAGQASPTLPLDHPAHLVLERLAAAGVLPPFPRGEGVRTRAQVARLLAAADSVASREAAGAADAPRARAIRDLVERGSRGLEEELREAPADRGIPTRRLLHQGGAEVATLDSPPRGIPANGLGTSSATVNPLGALHQGRPREEGTTLAVSTVHLWSGGGPVALQFQPVVRWAPGGEGTGTGSEPEMGVEQAAIKVRWGNLALRGGRDVLVREQWAGRGLVLSGGPRNWDLVEVGTADPVELPWVLGLLGPVEARLFWAHLGGEQTFDDGWMVGYRGSVRPHPAVEVGGTALFQQGGEGGPPAEWGERVLDALLIPDLLDADSDYLFSNKLVGMDLRVRLPWGPWGRGMEIFGEAALDDFDHRRVRSSFLDNGGFSGGVLLPSLDRAGRVSLAAALQRTGGSLYRHNRYRTGFTLEGRAVGTSLGPDGTGGYVRLAWFPEAPAIVTVEGAWERYRGDRYRVFGEPDFRYERVERLPVERRIRGVATVQWQSRGGLWDLLARVGGEQVRNPSFESGGREANLLAELAVLVRP